MATFNIRYSTVTIYNATIVADSEEEAEEILLSGECNPGEEYDSFFDDIHFVTKIGE